MPRKKIFIGLIPVLLILCVGCSTLLDEEFDVIRDPKPNYTDTNVSELEVVKVMSYETDKEYHFVRLDCLKVSPDGSIYCYDGMLKKIFKFDKNYLLVKTFGSQGQGPGEFSGRDFGMKKIHLSPNGNLYVYAPFNHKLIAFDKNGKHLKDIRLPNVLGIQQSLPIVDKKGNFYALSKNGGIIDVYNKDMTITRTLLDEQELKRSIFFRYSKPFFTFPTRSNIHYDIIPGGWLIVYYAYSARVTILKDFKVVKQFDFWPKQSIERFKEIFQKQLKKVKASQLVSLSENMFPDLDDLRYFYISSFPGNTLHKLDLNGKLIQTLKVRQGIRSARFEGKRNGCFYGRSGRGDEIRIYKIK